MTAEELSAWENRDVPSIDRVSDDSEARADEKQDATTSLNFPLHWTTAAESWNYLFDFSVACGLLAPRPDDLVLDFAAGTCWASELLGRLGVRTVSVDLSVEMMRRGRERLAADSRLVFRDDAAFVAARGQSLPFVDRQLRRRAVHERPAPSAFLRRGASRNPPRAQARRAGGLLGARHRACRSAVVAIPDARRERDRKKRLAPRHPPAGHGGRLQPDARGAAALLGRLRVRLRGARRPTATSRSGRCGTRPCGSRPGEHARFVLHKGDDPPEDTLLPAHQLAGRLEASIVLEQVSASRRARDGRSRIGCASRTPAASRGRRAGGALADR